MAGLSDVGGKGEGIQKVRAKARKPGHAVCREGDAGGGYCAGIEEDKGTGLSPAHTPPMGHGRQVLDLQQLGRGSTSRCA